MLSNHRNDALPPVSLPIDGVSWHSVSCTLQALVGVYIVTQIAISGGHIGKNLAPDGWILRDSVHFLVVFDGLRQVTTLMLVESKLQVDILIAPEIGLGFEKVLRRLVTPLRALQGVAQKELSLPTAAHNINAMGPKSDVIAPIPDLAIRDGTQQHQNSDADGRQHGA